MIPTTPSHIFRNNMCILGCLSNLRCVILIIPVSLIVTLLGALLQVSQAAAHANDSMKRIEQFKKLLEVQESIGGSIDLVSPTREVIKEGKIVKISARTGDHQDRYLFLVK